MILENKLGITNSADLAKAEERISKARALDLFEKGLLDTFEIGVGRIICVSIIRQYNSIA